ncbi:MAG: hypothetical protein J0I06_06015 [Planctomycetes bacterium]|nr:hypothetical protein [Planctomycetota bacterium]
MASLFKVTYVFEGQGRGWTESYWLSASYDEHEKAEGPTDRLAKLRANLLGLEARIKAFRISKESEGPDSYLVYRDYFSEKINIPGVDNGGNITTSAAMPDVAVLLRCMDSLKRRHKFVFLRGIPDRVETKNGQYTKDVVYDGLMKAFVKGLAAEQWGWWGVKQATKKSKIKIVSVTKSETSLVTFTFAENIFPAPLVGKVTRVRITGVNKKSAYNGTHLVRVNDATQCQTVNPLGVGPYYFGGVGAWTENEFVAIGSALDQKIVSRKAGAPLLESRGRQPARPRA